MTFSRIATTGAALPALALMLATACGGGDGEAGAGGADPADAPGTLTVWAMGTSEDPLARYFTDVEKTFQRTYPDTRVEVEFIPWDDAQESMTNAMAGGDAPDVVEVGNDQVSNWAAQGALRKLDGHIEDWDAVDDMDPDAAGFFPAYPDMLDDERYTRDPAKAAAAEQMTRTKFFPATPRWNSADQDGKVLPGAVLDIAKGEDADTVLSEANKELTTTLNEPVE